MICHSCNKELEYFTSDCSVLDDYEIQDDMYECPNTHLIVRTLPHSKKVLYCKAYFDNKLDRYFIYKNHEGAISLHKKSNKRIYKKLVTIQDSNYLQSLNDVNKEQLTYIFERLKKLVLFS